MNTMRFSLPEGGEAVLSWPEHISVESIEMLHDCLYYQMRAMKRKSEKAAALYDDWFVMEQTRELEQQR